MPQDAWLNQFPDLVQNYFKIESKISCLFNFFKEWTADAFNMDILQKDSKARCVLEIELAKILNFIQLVPSLGQDYIWNFLQKLLLK